MGSIKSVGLGALYTRVGHLYRDPQNPTVEAGFQIVDNANEVGASVEGPIGHVRNVADQIAQAVGLYTNHRTGVRLHLDLSTSHLPKTILDDLNGFDGVTAHRYRHGWMLWVPEDPREHAANYDDGAIPPIVVALQVYARLSGCDFVMLDEDADRIHGLDVVLRDLTAGPPPADPDPTRMHAPWDLDPDQLVWVSVIRKGIEVHDGRTQPSTPCGRFMRTGTRLSAWEASTIADSKWCPRCTAAALTTTTREGADA